MPTTLPSMSGDNELQAPAWWALLVGLALAALPIVHFSAGEGHEHATSSGAADATQVHTAHSGANDGDPTRLTAHADHTPHHGGQLGMVGRLHVELVQKADTIEVHLSNAKRRPLEPTHGTIEFDTGTTQPLARYANFLFAPADKAAREVTVSVAPRRQSDRLVEITFSIGEGTRAITEKRQ